ncbi:hypothetical protein [Sphaerisporangium perillae]|uniref:hypothetical protein n=1 Tax=Sphaerisporangium perillae TaxID=2935860 RepID=UPI00201054E5|nr:hypothetical protein [Sphaerisporangium perillae]
MNMQDSGGGGGYSIFYIDGSWPGDEDKDGVDVHHPSVKNLLKALEDDIEQLRGYKAGTAQHFKTHGTVAPAHMGEWDAAMQLHGVFSQAHTGLTTSYDKLVAQYEAALAVARAAFTNLGSAEQASDVGTAET